MSRKSLGLIALVLIIALASLGIAQGLWSETLNINGTVQTGTVNVELSMSGWTEDNEPANKDTATCTGALSDNNNTLTITISNAYPNYICYVKNMDVHNVGTIPVHVHQPVFTAPAELTVELENCYAQDVQLHTNDAAYCNWKITVLQSAAQGSSYTFTGTIFAHQYNEEP
jgi:hypothetical protein